MAKSEENVVTKERQVTDKNKTIHTPRKDRSRIKKTNKTKNDVSTTVVISCRYNYI